MGGTAACLLVSLFSMKLLHTEAFNLEHVSVSCEEEQLSDREHLFGSFSSSYFLSFFLLSFFFFALFDTRFTKLRISDKEPGSVYRNLRPHQILKTPKSSKKRLSQSSSIHFKIRVWPHRVSFLKLKPSWSKPGHWGLPSDRCVPEAWPS